MGALSAVGADLSLVSYVFLFGIAAILCFLSIRPTRQIEATDVRQGLEAFLATSGGWAAVHVGYLAAPTPRIQYAFFIAGLVVGLSTIGAWIYFCSAYTGRALHRNRVVRWTGIAVFTVIILVKITNPLPGQYFTAEMVATPFPRLVINQKPIHWIVIGLSYAVAFVGVFMLFERFAEVSYDTTPLFVVSLTSVPVLFDVLGVLTPFLLDLTYSPFGVAAFAVGVSYVYFEEFQTVRVAGPTTDPVIVLDAGERIRDTNRAARELFPSLSEHGGAALESVLPDVATAIEGTERVIAREDDGQRRYYRVMSSPFSANQTQLGRLVTLTDVTERERYRKELERKNDRLEEFASIVSHDLRNPLNVAEGRLALAIEECESAHLDPVADAHDRMAVLIEDLLLLARHGEEVREPDQVALALLVQRCWETVDTSSATLAVEVDRVVEADATRLKQLLENLIRNAIDHGGPDVTISVGSLADRFYLEDDGPGIPEVQRAEVFEAGYSTQSDGTGFGLYIVEQIVKAHGWEIRATAGTSDGARFEITGIGLGEQVDSPADQ